MSDHIESQQPDKVMHEWEQSTIGAEHVISALTIENQIVLDPLMGSGTTEVAAIMLKRNFIGIDINQNISKWQELELQIYTLKQRDRITTSMALANNNMVAIYLVTMPSLTSSFST